MHYKPIVGAALGNVLRSYLLSIGHVSLFGDLSVFSDSHNVQRVVKAFAVPCFASFLDLEKSRGHISFYLLHSPMQFECR